MRTTLSCSLGSVLAIRARAGCLWGLVGDTGGNVNKVSGLDTVLEFKVGAVEKFGDALQHVNRGFVGLMIVGLGGSAGRHHQHVHADGFGICGLC